MNGIQKLRKLSSLTCAYFRNVHEIEKLPSSITKLDLANYNPNLSCIEVDDPTWSTQNWTSNNFYLDNGVTLSTNCNYPAGCF